ncbi:MAG: hypothetical protein ACXWUE_41480 [Polyangiales bacterium]
MALFGRGKKKANEPEKPAPRAQPDFFSPLWQSWPPAEAVEPPPPPPPAEPEPIPAEAIPAVPILAEVVVEPPSWPPPVQHPNPPTVEGPPVVVQRVRQLSELPPPAPPKPRETPSGKMRAAIERRDWPAAREIAQTILAADPTDLDAYVCVETCTQRMRELAELRLGARDRVLRQSLPDDWLSNMELDPKVAYLLSRVDGASTIEEILEIAGLPKDDAVRVLADLLEDGVLEAVAPPMRPSSRPPR